MITTEKSFPRGGTVRQKPEFEEKVIFGAKQIKKKDRRKTKEDSNDLENEYENTFEQSIQSNSAETLNYKTIQEGMLIMGLVKSVDPTCMKVSLPGGITGKVFATSISQSYNNIINKYIQSSESIENYKPLNELFTVGQTVYAKVMEIKNSEIMNIILSLRPIDVHVDLTHDNMKKGMVFNGAVEEVQEHGYIIESGIKSFRCFLPLEKSYLEHSVGQLISLKVDKLTQTSAASTAICKEVSDSNRKIKDGIEPKLDYMLPGTIVNFTITNILKNGLQGTVMNENFTGYVNEHQLNEPLAVPKDFKLNSTVSAKILYIMPLTKLLYLSLNLTPPITEPQLKRGDIIENAVVHHIGTGGVVLLLKNRFKGILSFKSIKTSYMGNYDENEIQTQFCPRSKHKVRILGYDIIDSLYICSNDPKIINAKTFTIDNLQLGEIVQAKVLGKDNKDAYILAVGNVKGRIDPLFLSAATKNLLENSLVRCRVMSIDTVRKFIHLSNHPEYLSKHCKILLSTQQAKLHSIFLGTIVNCEDKFCIVKFFNNLKGILYKRKVNGIMDNENLSFYNGLTMQFRIISSKNDKIIVGLADDVYKMGEIVPAKVTHILSSGLELQTANGNTEQEQLKVIVPVRLLSDYPDLVSIKLKTFNVNDNVETCCIAKNIFSIRDVSYFQNNATKPLTKVKPGDILRSFIKNIQDEIIELQLPIFQLDQLVKVHLSMVLTNCIKNPNIVATPDQIVYVKVLNVDARAKIITLTAKLTDVWNGDLKVTSNYFSKYIEEMQLIQNNLQDKTHPLGKIKIGQQLKATVQGYNNETGDWYLNLPNGGQGILKRNFVTKCKFVLGEEQTCIVLWIDYLNELIYVSNRESELSRISEQNELPTNLVNATGTNAKILLKLDNVVVCSVKKGINPVVYIPTRLHFNDFERITTSNFSEGDFVRLTFIHKTHPIAVLDKTYKFWNDINKKRKKNANNDPLPSKKMKIVEKPIPLFFEDKIGIRAHIENKPSNFNVDCSKHQLNSQEKLEHESKQSSLNVDCPKHQLNSKEKLDNEQSLTKRRRIKALPGASDFWSTELPNDKAAEIQSCSEDDDFENTNINDLKKKKKETAADRFRASKEEDRRLRQIEENYSNPNILPDTPDQFDRLVISEPNCSKNWINYMVFHLQATEIDKARSVARRGIKTISFREELEIMNVWVALLNLELRYGTKESFKDTLKEALTSNDPIQMYLRIFEILADANKTQELIEIINTATKKYKDQINIWKNGADAYFKVGMADRAKQMLSKSLLGLPERDHINATVAFANLNHKHSDIETAHALFEQVITSYPKRVDVWSQYIDMLIKDDQIESARNTLERAVIQKIPLKKMKTLFKKFLEFEEKFGNEDNIQKVKQMASNYIQKEVNA